MTLYTEQLHDLLDKPEPANVLDRDAGGENLLDDAESECVQCLLWCND